MLGSNESLTFIKEDVGVEILTCIKQVPGTTEVEVDEETGVLKRSGIDSKMNPYDLYAIETAMQIKKETGAVVGVISMGPPQAGEVIREAYMIGADKGALLSDRKFAGADVLATSFTIAQGVKKVGMPDLIICGKQTTDGDTAQVGPELAEFLGIPHVANVINLVEVKEDAIVVDMDLPSAVQTVEIEFPCLITVEKGIFEPRLPSFTLKMETKDRDIPVYSLKDFENKDDKKYGLNGSPTQVLRIFSPESSVESELWAGSGDELAGRLFDKLVQAKFV